MRIIEQLVYKIQGDNSEFDKSITQSETKVSKFGSVADKMLAGVTVAAIGMVIKKMGDMVISSATALDRVDKLSQKIGLSRVAFQEWDYILGQSGASVEGLQTGLKTLSSAADEAKKGTVQYAEAFDRLGVSVTDANGKMKDQETLFAEVFSALADVENQTERTALATDLLGRSATELAPTLNTSKEGIEQLRKEAHDLGLVYSDELVDAGVILGDNIDRITKSFDAFKTKALSPIIGLAVTFTDKLLGQDSATKNLETSTLNLADSMKSYKDITAQLTDPLANLTEAEKALLEIQQERARFQINKAIVEVGRDYENTQRELRNLEIQERHYQNTIDESLAIINSYSEAQKEELRNYQHTGRAVTQQLIDKGKLLTAEENLEKAQLDLLEVQGKQIEKNSDFEASIFAISRAVVNGQIDLDTLANINVDFANKVSNAVAVIEKQKAGIAEADKRLAGMNRTTLEGIQYQLDYYKSIQDGYKDTFNVAMITRILNTLQDEKNKLLVEAANATNDANEKDRARKEILDTMSESIARAEQYSLAFGDSYDLNSQKASILESTIKSLVDSGLTAEDKAVADLVNQLEALGVEIDTVNEKTSENTNYTSNAQKALDKWVDAQDRAAQGARNTGNVIKEEATPALKSFGDTMEEIGTTGFNSFLSGFEDIGKAIGEGSNVWKAFEAAGLNAIAAVVEALGHELAARAVIHALALDWAGFGLATAGAASAYTAAGLLRANIPSYDVGSIRIPETTQAVVHKDEMILTAPQAEQARREGITIAPNKASGNSVNLVIYLDGKEIARNTIDNLNSGSVGTIKARVVK